MTECNSGWNLKILLALSVMLLGATPARADKELFVKLKCSKCHSISTLAVEKIKGSADADEEGEDEEKGAEPPDLSHVGANHDAAFFSSYLTKKSAHTPHADVKSTSKHKLKFKGSDEELNKLAAWLATLK